MRCRGACAPAPTAATTTGRTRVRFLDDARSRAQRGERFCERARGAAALWHPTAHYRRRRRRPRGPPPDDRSAQRVGGEIGLDDVYLMNYYLKGRSATPKRRRLEVKDILLYIHLGIYSISFT